MTETVRESWKRPFDLCVVALSALLLLPVWVVLAVAVPLAIRLEGPGPVLYRQARLGRGGRVFAMLKFRTMVDGAELRTGPVWAAWRDARVTRVGGFPGRCAAHPDTGGVVRHPLGICLICIIFPRTRESRPCRDGRG